MYDEEESGCQTQWWWPHHRRRRSREHWSQTNAMEMCAREEEDNDPVTTLAWMDPFYHCEQSRYAWEQEDNCINSYSSDISMDTDDDHVTSSYRNDTYTNALVKYHRGEKLSSTKTRELSLFPMWDNNDDDNDDDVSRGVTKRNDSSWNEWIKKLWKVVTRRWIPPLQLMTGRRLVASCWDPPLALLPSTSWEWTSTLRKRPREAMLRTNNSSRVDQGHNENPGNHCCSDRSPITSPTTQSMSLSDDVLTSEPPTKRPRWTTGTTRTPSPPPESPIAQKAEAAATTYLYEEYTTNPTGRPRKRRRLGFLFDNDSGR
jgi:hypothetical protein